MPKLLTLFLEALKSLVYMIFWTLKKNGMISDERTIESFQDQKNDKKRMSRSIGMVKITWTFFLWVVIR